MENPITQESHFIPITPNDQLHLRRIYQNKNGPPIFMLHGTMEDGRVFYTNDNKGLAPFLARYGYDVFVGDLRGRGQSTPAIGRHSSFGQTEAITEDIPAFLETICRLRGPIQQHWIAHSWGGVLLAAHLARFSSYRPLVSTLTCIASKRTIRVNHLEKWIKIDLFWNRAARFLTRLFGYLPSHVLRIGSASESKKSHDQCVFWVNSPRWIDPEDQFDYGEAIRTIEFPPTLYLVGIKDSYLGHPNDVYDFMIETCAPQTEFRILGRKHGNLRDYGHINILTDPLAINDHFPLILNWMKKDRSKNHTLVDR